MSSSDPSIIELVIPGRPRDVAGFPVRRALPSMQRRHVGPFVFFDHMGPIDLQPGKGMDVPPHPHIGLATVTYLFDGEILHRDSLGSEQVIRPGDVNWMTAGRGIVHSERTPAGARARGGRAYGLQSWVALPLANEEAEPEFHHHASSSIPEREQAGARLRVLAGTAYGLESPVPVLVATLYVQVKLDPGAEIVVEEGHAERATYIVEGEVELGGAPRAAGELVVLRQGARATVRAKTASNVMLIGGAPLDGPRHVCWDFVSSSRERIERAKSEWREGRFAVVPGDEVEFIELPEKSRAVARNRTTHGRPGRRLGEARIQRTGARPRSRLTREGVESRDARCEPIHSARAGRVSGNTRSMAHLASMGFCTTRQFLRPRRRNDPEYSHAPIEARRMQSAASCVARLDRSRAFSWPSL